MDLNLRGQSVTRVCFDAAFTLLTSEDYEVRVEADASIQAPGGELVVFDPESPGATAAQLVSLVHDTITSAEVGSVGGLHISFESGAEIGRGSGFRLRGMGACGAELESSGMRAGWRDRTMERTVAP
ncbi:DUF6188 family protein [Streptomyces hygroscopicus]